MRPKCTKSSLEQRKTSARIRTIIQDFDDHAVFYETGPHTVDPDKPYSDADIRALDHDGIIFRVVFHDTPPPDSPTGRAMKGDLL